MALGLKRESSRDIQDPIAVQTQTGCVETAAQEAGAKDAGDVQLVCFKILCCCVSVPKCLCELLTSNNVSYRACQKWAAYVCEFVAGGDGCWDSILQRGCPFRPQQPGRAAKGQHCFGGHARDSACWDSGRRELRRTVVLRPLLRRCICWSVRMHIVCQSCWTVVFHTFVFHTFVFDTFACTQSC